MLRDAILAVVEQRLAELRFAGRPKAAVATRSAIGLLLPDAPPSTFLGRTRLLFVRTRFLFRRVCTFWWRPGNRGCLAGRLLEFLRTCSGVHLASLRRRERLELRARRGSRLVCRNL